jgi:hypothetical protein
MGKLCPFFKALISHVPSGAVGLVTLVLRASNPSFAITFVEISVFGFVLTRLFYWSSTLTLKIGSRKKAAIWTLKALGMTL